jgi:hypothetical protein
VSAPRNFQQMRDAERGLVSLAPSAHAVLCIIARAASDIFTPEVYIVTMSVLLRVMK